MSIANNGELSHLNCTDTKQVKLLGVIDEGSFSTVYRAIWRRCVVAAKFLQLGHETESESASKL